MPINFNPKKTPEYELAIILYSTLHLINEFIDTESCSIRKSEEQYRECIAPFFRKKTEEWRSKNETLPNIESLLQLATEAVSEYYVEIISKKTY